MKKLSILLMLCFVFTASFGYINPELKKQIETKKDGIISTREDCQPAESQTDLDINNVRARLLVGGDLWWDKRNGRYIVPKPAPGFPEVSALFAGGVWIGGTDQNGNLKLAAVTYAQGNETDWYPGPLEEDGTTEFEECKKWDRFFKVTGQEVREHVAKFLASDGNYNCDSIADNVKYWPAKGNDYFAEKFGFQLPDQSLAPFHDEDLDGQYDPCFGDFPIIEIRGCEPIGNSPERVRERALKLLPDEMVFWIYNDNGGQHRSSTASPIQMEVQVQAFAYATNDEINDMTFYRYKLINKATDPIGECYFAMFVDPDLGCFEDDYVGCDTTKVVQKDRLTGKVRKVSRDLMYVYNTDAVDGTGGTCSCGQGVNTYCNEVPVLGVDYFRGPRRPYRFVKDADGNPVVDANGDKELEALKLNDEDKNIDTLLELGMTSFTYFNNSGQGAPPEPTTDPTVGIEFYRYMTGLWKNGTPFTVGGSGFNPESTDTTLFAVPSFPNDNNGWSMCTADLGPLDRRTIQATGPLLLTPGASNELIVGVVYVPDMNYPCPDMTRLIAADEIAQNLFDACFEIVDGPDAPDMYSVELDRELILLLGNKEDPIKNNNAFEQYEGIDINAPVEVDDNTYKFEGYKIYQLANANVSLQELDDEDKARLVGQVDLKNGISEIYNWTNVSNPLPEFSSKPVWTFKKMVDGADLGIRHSFNITNDAFATGDTRLINHKNYYYTVITYAYNNYATFDESAPESTQNMPYLEGRRNLTTYTFTPRPIVYNNLNSVYGEQAEVTRLDGEGSGTNFLDLEDGIREQILAEGEIDVIPYKKGFGPVEVKVVDPLRITDGEYTLEVQGDYKESSKNPRIGENARWVLTENATGTVIAADKSFEVFNEQIIAGKGFSIEFNQVEEPSETVSGYIGEALEYADPNANNWLRFIKPSVGITYSLGNGQSFPIMDFANPDLKDGASDFATSADFMIPMPYTRFTQDTRFSIDGQVIYSYSPGWNGLQFFADGQEIDHVNNVDIVFTSDKSKWSRCPVVETANPNYNSQLSQTNTIGGAAQFDLRKSPSVDKDGNPTSGTGMGWFPGYAVDVETGERLNVFFGENSAFNDENDNAVSSEPGSANNGDDMIFNPTSNVVPDGFEFNLLNPFSYYGGGQHFVYVTRQKYDEGAALAEYFAESDADKGPAVAFITWAGWPLVAPGMTLNSLADGLIPNDVVVKLRAQNKYNKELNPKDFDDAERFVTEGGMPKYLIKFSGKEITETVVEETNDILDDVAVVPNPYYAYSAYENTQFATTVKVTNLPDVAIVTIYSLDGKFIRQFNRSETPSGFGDIDNPLVDSRQTTPSLEWDLKNSKGIPVASGVYIFHIEAPDLNAETTVKWFGVNRKFDPSGL